MIRSAPFRAPARGLTLVEVMVVVVIIAVLASAVVIALPDSGGDQILEREVNRLTALIELAGEEALFQGRDLGLHIDLDRYSWHQFDSDALNWVPLQDIEQLRPRDLPEVVEFELTVEGRGAKLAPTPEERRATRRREAAAAADADAEDGEQAAPTASTVTPQVLILASGELTPFTLAFQSEVASRRYLITGHPIGSLEITEEESL